MRSGTVPHTLVIGMGAACEIAQKEMKVLMLNTLSIFNPLSTSMMLSGLSIFQIVLLMK